jgi:hypothetical protein
MLKGGNIYKSIFENEKHKNQYFKLKEVINHQNC